MQAGLFWADMMLAFRERMQIQELKKQEEGREEEEDERMKERRGRKKVEGRRSIF